MTNTTSCSISRGIGEANPTLSTTNSLHHSFPILQPQRTTSLSSAEHHGVNNTYAFNVSHDAQQGPGRSLVDIIDDALEITNARLNDDVDNTHAFNISHDSQQGPRRNLVDIIDDALEIANACLNDDAF
eukprot:CAMPEP_0195266828 /NCGR_PEP_ID=MMETSP0706-20130129/12240_1 /TAXON_ID=33640 /ORGANISM="Asterionellopsis glacialis, Strain CCMP134" /LENGTH=128 /DNA_ID=CAMNT_0040321489 /DNA_START=49 /DNA_END=435 /DNA_ORIENTATION=+